MGQWFSDILGLEMVNYGWQCSFSNALFFGHFWSFDRTYEGLKLLTSIIYTFPSYLQFWSYLWGIETSLSCHSMPDSPSFWSYLWGIETVNNANAEVLVGEVLIVPMRDWNPLAVGHERDRLAAFWSYLWGIETRKPWCRAFRQCTGFDRTYEGLKLPKPASHRLFVLFGSYLWRREAFFRLITQKIIGWGGFMIVPNEGIETTRFRAWRFQFVCIWPKSMKDLNLIVSRAESGSFPCFDRTL